MLFAMAFLRDCKWCSWMMALQRGLIDQARNASRTEPWEELKVYLYNFFHEKICPKFHDEILGTCGWLGHSSRKGKFFIPIAFWPVN